MASLESTPKLAQILRHKLGEIMPSGKARAWSLAEYVIKLGCGQIEGQKPSDAIAAQVFIRDTAEGKPKETHEIIKGNDITPEMLAAKRLELEQAMSVPAPTRIDNLATAPVDAVVVDQPSTGEAGGVGGGA